VVDERNRGKLTFLDTLNGQKFVRTKFTSFSGNVSYIYSAAMKGKPENGICFVTAMLTNFMTRVEIEAMTRDECLRVFKTFYKDLPEVPEIIIRGGKPELDV